MALKFWLVFQVLVSILCYRAVKCSEELLKTLPEEENCGGKICHEAKIWTRFYSGNRRFYLPVWLYQPNKFVLERFNGMFVVKFRRICLLNASEGIHQTDAICVKNLNAFLCERNDGYNETSNNSDVNDIDDISSSSINNDNINIAVNNTIVPGLECLYMNGTYSFSLNGTKPKYGKIQVISKRHYSVSDSLFPVPTELYFPYDSFNIKNDNMMEKSRFLANTSEKMAFSETGIPVESTAASTVKKMSDFLGKSTASGATENLSATGYHQPHPTPCKFDEIFYNESCYYLVTYKVEDETLKYDNLSRNVFLTNLSENISEICHIPNKNGLGLEVDTKKENRFVIEYLKNVTLKYNSIVFTSGFLPVGKQGEWKKWNLKVDENVIDHKPAVDRSEVMLYVIDKDHLTWLLLNFSMFLTIPHNNIWHVMCKRHHDERRVQNELNRQCAKLYREDESFNPFVYVKYCCAVDENGTLWFGYPNKIITYNTKDGLDCAWNCGDDGMFVQEYPICRKKIACNAIYNNTAYSAPIGRHAIGSCHSGLYGYSTWYCAYNKNFVDTPKYICCKTNNMCKATDYYLNMWVSCPGQKASKLIKCPAGSQLQKAVVEWYCTTESHFNGSSPDYSNCKMNNIVCQGVDKHNRKWAAQAGTMARKKCPNYGKEMCYWKCNEWGKYETPEPDCSTCQMTWTQKIFDKINDGMHYKVVMEIMENHTRVEDLTIGFSQVLNLTSACVDLFKNQTNNNKTEFNDFLKFYSKILKNVAGKPSIWSSFLGSNRKEYAKRIIKTTQHAAFAYLDLPQALKSEKFYNATLADFKNDGFDFFVQYSSSLSGTKFPLDKYVDSNWRLEVQDVNDNGTNFAVMGLVMNHSLSYLMFPSGCVKQPRILQLLLVNSDLFFTLIRNETSDLAMNSPAVTFTVATATEGQTKSLPNVSISLTLRHVNRTRQPESGVIRRKLHEGEIPSGVLGSTACYYYGYTDWNRQGCFVSHTSRYETTCTCRHLSTIGLLMSVQRYEPDPILETISIVSSSISIVSLILTIIVFCTFDSIRNERILIGVNLCVCLMSGHFLLLTVMDKKFFYFPDSLCSVYAILLHYAFLAAFAWMFMEGCHLYRMLILVFESNIEFRFIYTVIGYGMPVFVICITEFIGLINGEQPYGQDELCWLQTPNYVWAFNAPVILLTSVNFVFLIVAMRLAVASKARTQKSRFYNLRIWIKGCFSLSVLLGITWLFGLSYVQYNQFFAYIFVVLNGLQGFFIFIFRCLCNVQYKKVFLQRIKLFFPKFLKSGTYKSQKMDIIRSGTKLFAITQSGAKSSGTDSDVSSSSLSLTWKSPLRWFFKFSVSNPKIPMKNHHNHHVGEDETSSGMELDCGGVMACSQDETLRSRLSAGNSKTDSDNDEKRDEIEAGMSWWRNQHDFPELSYHTAYYRK